MLYHEVPSPNITIRNFCIAVCREIARDRTRERGRVDDSVPLPTVLRAIIYTVEALLASDATQTGGVVLVVDLHGLSMSRAQRLHPEVGGSVMSELSCREAAGGIPESAREPSPVHPAARVGTPADPNIPPGRESSW
jgi:hypothetical protein